MFYKEKKRCPREPLLGKQNMFGYFYSTCFYRVKHTQRYLTTQTLIYKFVN